MNMIKITLPFLLRLCVIFQHKTMKISLKGEVILYKKYHEEHCMMMMIIRTLSSMCSWHLYALN